MEDATASSSTQLIHTDELHNDEIAGISNSDLIKKQLNSTLKISPKSALICAAR